MPVTPSLCPPRAARRAVKLKCAEGDRLQPEWLSITSGSSLALASLTTTTPTSTASPTLSSSSTSSNTSTPGPPSGGPGPGPGPGPGAGHGAGPGAGRLYPEQHYQLQHQHVHGQGQGQGGQHEYGQHTLSDPWLSLRPGGMLNNLSSSGGIVLGGIGSYTLRYGSGRTLRHHR